jgi:hypothetical protein
MASKSNNFGKLPSEGKTAMSIDNVSDQASRALVAHNPERYSAALEIARQLNAEFKNRRALRLFNALTKREDLSVVIGAVGVVGAIGAAAVGIAAALRSSRHAEHDRPEEPPARQLIIVNQTAIQVSRAELAVLSRTRIVELKD